MHGGEIMDQRWKACLDSVADRGCPKGVFSGGSWRIMVHLYKDLHNVSDDTSLRYLAMEVLLKSDGKSISR